MVVDGDEHAEVVDGDEHARGSDGTRSAAAKCGAAQRTSTSEDADDHCIVQRSRPMHFPRRALLARLCCMLPRAASALKYTLPHALLGSDLTCALPAHSVQRVARRELWANGALGPMCALESDKSQSHTVSPRDMQQMKRVMFLYVGYTQGWNDSQRVVDRRQNLRRAAHGDPSKASH